MYCSYTLLTVVCCFISINFVLLEGIDGPVTSQFTSPEPAFGGLLVNVGSEEVGTQPRAKVCTIYSIIIIIP